MGVSINRCTSSPADPRFGFPPSFSEVLQIWLDCISLNLLLTPEMPPLAQNELRDLV